MAPMTPYFLTDEEVVMIRRLIVEAYAARIGSREPIERELAGLGHTFEVWQA